MTTPAFATPVPFTVSRTPSVTPLTTSPRAVLQVPVRPGNARPFQALVHAYENLIQRRAAPSPSPSPAPVLDAPEAMPDGLTCDWSPEIGKERKIAQQEMHLEALVAMGNYESFLAGPDAIGVDLSVPVYFTAEGALVCQMRRE